MRGFKLRDATEEEHLALRAIRFDNHCYRPYQLKDLRHFRIATCAARLTLTEKSLGISRILCWDAYNEDFAVFFALMMDRKKICSFFVMDDRLPEDDMWIGRVIMPRDFLPPEYEHITLALVRDKMYTQPP